jgi:hypothetical protein
MIAGKAHLLAQPGLDDQGLQESVGGWVRVGRMKRPGVIAADAIPALKDQQFKVWPHLMKRKRDERICEASAD